MSEEEILNLKIMVSNLDLSIDSKEKLYNQISKISFLLQQKENIIKEDRELLEKIYKVLPSTYNQLLIEIKQILDKENK